MKKLLLLFAFFAAVAQSCDEPEDPYAEQRDLLEKQDFKISQHLEENNITAVKDDYGIYRVALEENPEGEEIAFGDVALVNYTISQLDGTLIGENEVESMRLGYLDPNQNNIQQRYLPTALFVALGHMREGETYRFYVPFNTAYGNFDLTGVVPNQSIIVIEMEVEEVYQTKEELFAADLAAIDSAVVAREDTVTDTLSTGIRKVLLEEGEGEMVDANDVVSVEYTGYLLNGKEFDSNTSAGDPLFEFVVGAGKTIPGFETAVKSMKKGEKAVFYIPSTQAYGSDGVFIGPELVRSKFNAAIPPHSPLIFEIELVELVKK
ncbi:FKBP-type peptidyl-prolyl cis-trans isomerase [Nafulsella turpanensis]|uniref:FKBP-type peptidyl-prolyl cis-trans isomerase n=1 Tax=Nafulsella turpanensis TaxID=1265690 RepID=UPI000345022A|nr:FKBP-type peptidyl-prolyl cis-trans isomerase [Nafulsella turpanensis]